MRGGSARATYRDALAGRKKVPTLRNGETRWLSTANGRLSDLLTIEAVCAVTGLQKLGVARQR